MAWVYGRYDGSEKNSCGWMNVWKVSQFGGGEVYKMDSLLFVGVVNKPLCCRMEPRE